MVAEDTMVRLVKLVRKAQLDHKDFRVILDLLVLPLAMLVQLDILVALEMAAMMAV
jgi:hypothetical protein